MEVKVIVVKVVAVEVRAAAGRLTAPRDSRRADTDGCSRERRLRVT